MSNDYKACPFAKELCLQGENGEPRKTVGWLCSVDCDKCPAHNPSRNGYNSVFNAITQSQEVLAGELVYKAAIRTSKLIYDRYSRCVGVRYDIEEVWKSAITEDTYTSKSEAHAATVAKLKEVADENRRH